MRARTRYSLVILGILLIIYLMLWDTIARPLFESQASDLYGGQVSVDRVEMSVWQGKTTLYNIQVADRSSLMRNLAEARRVYVDIHLMRLLAKNVVEVESMEIEGLTVFTDRETPADIIRPLLEPDSDLARAGLPDFDPPDLDALIAKRHEAVLEDLAALEQVFQEAERKWRPRIAELPSTAEVAALRSRLERLEQAHEAGEANDELAAQAREVQAEVAATLTAVDTMYKEFGGDFQRLQTALAEADSLPDKHTRILLRELGLSQDQTAQLGNEMIRGELSGVMQQVLAPIVYSAAGEIDQGKTPVYIEQASISGPLLNPARELQVSGELRNFTWPLENASEAATLVLSGEGSAGGQVHISATVDHRDGVEDDIEVAIRDLVMEDMQLEGDEELALELTSARATIEGALRVRGETLSGDIHQHYTDARFNTTLSPDAGEAAQLIALMMETNQAYRLDMRFAGTPASPILSYESDMDEQFRATIEAAVADEVRQLTTAIQARAASEARPRVAQARQVIAELRELEATLEDSLGALDQLNR